MSGLQGVQKESLSHTHGHINQSRLILKTNIKPQLSVDCTSFPDGDYTPSFSCTRKWDRPLKAFWGLVSGLLKQTSLSLPWLLVPSQKGQTTWAGGKRVLKLEWFLDFQHLVSGWRCVGLICWWDCLMDWGLGVWNVFMNWRRGVFSCSSFQVCATYVASTLNYVTFFNTHRCRLCPALG